MSSRATSSCRSASGVVCGLLCTMRAAASSRVRAYSARSGPGGSARWIGALGERLAHVHVNGRDGLAPDLEVPVVVSGLAGSADEDGGELVLLPRVLTAQPLALGVDQAGEGGDVTGVARSQPHQSPPSFGASHRPCGRAKVPQRSVQDDAVEGRGRHPDVDVDLVADDRRRDARRQPDHGHLHVWWLGEPAPLPGHVEGRQGTPARLQGALGGELETRGGRR